jgi:acetyl-CoA carboxylase carboxyl transferase subunit alpha
MINDGLPFERPILDLERKIEELENNPSARVKDLETLGQLRKMYDDLRREIYAKLTPWERVLVARHPQRPQTSDYLELMVDGFLELHGDRAFRDDAAIITGLGKIEDKRFMIVGHQKGKSTRERLSRSFGCPYPEGYRKSLIKMKLAEKCGLPILTLIDTPGAHPGIGAEERGQAQAIATNLYEMARLKTPIICIIIGEGGSGGALGIAVGDKLSILENAYYSVISPEGCAAILWKNAENAPQAAEALHLTANDLLELGIVDEVLKEPLGGAHRNPEKTAQTVKEAVLRYLGELQTLSTDELLERRYKKYRHLGRFLEGAAEAPS